ncbi:MAG: shikimate kinase [Chloroflexota bacterium]
MQNGSIVLIGMAGVGKSTVGRLLSCALRCRFIDVDDDIVAKSGKALQDIIDDDGEEALLQIEKQRMFAIDMSCPVVVAPGGSIIYHPDLMEHLKQHATLVYLEDSFETITARLGDISKRGIIGLKSKTLKEIHEERKPLYSRWADLTLNCRDKSPEIIVKEILEYYLHTDR